MDSIYQHDLAYVQATGFSEFARGVAPEIVRRLRTAATAIHNVFEVGCGAGPLTAVLVDAGFAVSAIDISTHLLALAREAAPEARFEQGSIYESEIPSCEAVLALGEPLTYHSGVEADRQVREFLRRASKILPEGGMLIFDVIELGETSLAGRFWKSGEDWAVMVETSEDQSARSLVREIEVFRKVGELYRRGRETHRVRLFDTSEIDEWLRDAGFTVETARAFGEYSLAPRRRAFFCIRGTKPSREDLLSYSLP